MMLLRNCLEVIGNPQSSSEDIKKASKILTQECFKQTDSIPGLLEIAAQDENLGIRHLAAIEVRKLIQKEEGQMWELLDSQVRESIKNNILAITVNEKSILVRHSFAHVIAVIAKNELRNGRWADLVETLYQACSSADVVHREIGVYVLYSLFEVIADQMESYIPQLMNLFSKLIYDSDSLIVGVTTVQALGKISEFIDEQDMDAICAFQNLVPAIVQVLQKCLQTGDDDGVSKIFEVFNDMLLLEAPLLSKHFIDLIKLFLSISESLDNSDDIRVQSLSFLMWCIMSAKNKISKSRLITPILSSMFAIAAEEEPDSRDEDYPAKLAIQVINTLATTFPPQQVFPEASQLSVTRLRSANPGERKSSMLAMAVLVEGCADYMRPHLKDVLGMIVVGMKDSHAIVQKAACMALGALSDDFEDEISIEHPTLIPILFSLISNDSDPSIHSEALSTLDVFIENLGADILPYMDALLARLFILWETGSSKAQITTTNCIGSVAYAANSDFLPYFEKTMTRLSALMISSTDPSDLSLRSVATDCVGAVASAVGRDVFKPYLDPVMQTVILGMQLGNPQLNQCSYVLCGVLGKQFETEFSPYLQIIVPPILHSCQNEEKEFRAREVDIGEDDDKPIFASGIAQEKESSVDTLGELFSATKASFLPFVADALNTALELLDHYHESVRVSAAGCLLKFFHTAYGMSRTSSSWDAGLPLKTPLHENVANIGKLAMEGVLLLISDEEDRMVVTQCLTQLSETIKIVGPAAFCQQFSGENPAATGSHLDMLANQLLLILRSEHTCQSVDALDDGDAEEDLAELDALVITAAADTIGAIAAAIGPQFSSYFQSFFPLISKFYKKNKPLADRSMAIGAIAEAVDGLEGGVTIFTNDLMNLFLKALKDEEEEVRSNAAYGAGVLVLHTEAAEVRGYYPRLLQLLHPLLSCDSEMSNVQDNACGALCRMILKYPDSVPLDQAIPLILNCLPLKNDFEENRPVFKTLVMLLNSGNALMLIEVPRFFSIFATVLNPNSPNQLGEETKMLLTECIQNVKTNHSELFQTILAQLAPEVRVFYIE